MTYKSIGLEIFKKKNSKKKKFYLFNNFLYFS